MKNSPKKIVLLVCTVFCVLFIWINSMLPAEVSGSMSGYAEKILREILGDSFVLGEGIIRKLAHGFEFAVLGTVISFFEFEGLKKRLFRVCFFGLFTAVCDETIQLFSKGRFSSVKDIWIDFIGFAAGTAVVFLLKIIIDNVNERKGKR